jgi:hypothetical protein
MAGIWENAMEQRPISIGLLVCDQVVIEEKTRNVTLVNCFTNRTVERFPAVMSSFVVFAGLTNGSGETPFEIVIQRLDTLDEIYRRSFSIYFGNPLQEIRCMVRIRNCSFPVAGQYQVILFADNEPVAQRKIRIVPKEE